MTPEQFQKLKEEMAVETEMMRDESLFLIYFAGKKYNLHDGSLSESPSPKGYYSAEAFLNDLERKIHAKGNLVVIEKVS